MSQAKIFFFGFLNFCILLSSTVSQYHFMPPFSINVRRGPMEKEHFEIFETPMVDMSRQKDSKVPKTVTYADEGGNIFMNFTSQKLNHFDGQNEFWKQRFWVNKRFYKPNGPVFLYLLSGSMDDDLYWIGGGDEMPDWILKAQSFGALCFLVEHRFYGGSKPTSDLTTKNLRYLNTYQALADFASFIEFAKDAYKLKDASWVAFGCSYAGSLAAWLRLKYPHLVKIAVASGAPLEAKLDFFEFAEQVEKILASENKTCVDQIEEATKTLDEWLKDPEKKQKVKEMFMWCPNEDIDPNDKKNVSAFFSMLANSIFNIVQTDKIKKGRAPEGMSVQTLCKMMTDASLGDALQRYAALHEKINLAAGIKCLQISYQNLVDYLTETTYSEYDSLRQWAFQTCNEFGFHPTSSSPYQPFGRNFPLQFYLDQCKDVFGRAMQPEYLQENIKETLRQYGGKNPSVTNVIFTYGANDPWHPLTVSEERKSRKVVVIEGSSHCAEMYTPRDTDSKSMKSGRQKTDRLIKKWLAAGAGANRSLESMILAIQILLVTFCYFLRA